MVTIGMLPLHLSSKFQEGRKGRGMEGKGGQEPNSDKVLCFIKDRSAAQVLATTTFKGAGH